MTYLNGKKFSIFQMAVMSGDTARFIKRASLTDFM